jgi:hypothetical protein
MSDTERKMQVPNGSILIVLTYVRRWTCGTSRASRTRTLLVPISFRLLASNPSSTLPLYPIVYPLCSHVYTLHLRLELDLILPPQPLSMPPNPASLRPDPEV